MFINPFFRDAEIDDSFLQKLFAPRDTEPSLYSVELKLK